MRWNALMGSTLSEMQLNHSSWNDSQHSVLRARSSSSFWTSEATPWVYQITGTQSSSLWELGLQWSGSPSGGPCSWEMMLCSQLFLQGKHCLPDTVPSMRQRWMLRSSVQCISLITALWALCTNKHNIILLQNGLGEPMDWMLNHTLTLCPWPGATHAQWILLP